MSSERIKVWGGCSPTVAMAVETFCNRWGPYSTRSRTYSIFRLFEEVIEPAWRGYVSTVPITYSGSVLCRDLQFGHLARAVGFQTLEGIIADILRNLSLQSENSIDAELDCAHEFEMTLEMMRVITRACYAKRPKTKNARNNRLTQETCTYCGEDTELVTQSILDHEPEGSVRLSSKYCSKHRPKFGDGTRNPEYLRAARHAAEYETEIKRIQLQSTCLTKPNAQTEDVFLDDFYFKLVSSYASYNHEVQFINNQARTLINERVTDSKKRIVMMRASGLSLSEIANSVGVKSRQAVSKAVNSIPSFYRFDIKASPPPAEDIFRGLNETLLAAMKNNKVVAIHLNPDGVLWAESLEIGRHKIGEVFPWEAEMIIHRVAERRGIKLTGKNCSVIADLPSYFLRFTGILPPIAESPTFTIIKMQPDD